jgi:membrane-associated phospholipid phosphatase
MASPDRKPWLMLALLLAATIISICFVDRPVAELAASFGPGLRNLAEQVTWFGRSTAWLVLLALVGVGFAIAARFAKRPRSRLQALCLAGSAAYLWLSVALAGLANDVVKMVGRPRPTVNATGLSPFHFSYDYESFPSGHTAVAFALAFALARLDPRWHWPALIFAIAVGASRVILRVHYPGDVLGGALVALLTVRLLTAASAKYGLVFRRLPDGRIRRRFPSLTS